MFETPKKRTPGKILMGIRLRLGYTQEEFGRLFGYSKSRMSLYERDRGSPGFKARRHIIAVLDERRIKIRADELMNDTDKGKLESSAEPDGEVYYDMY